MPGENRISEWIIGVPKEIKIQEYGVAIIPTCIVELIVAGHEVIIESGAGVGSGFAGQDMGWLVRE